jgi:hypothetical protein
MTGEEANIVCQMAVEACPSQAWGEYTADIWADALEPFDFTVEECRAAIAAIKRRQVWVDVHDIIEQVRRARRPAEDAERLHTFTDPAAYREHIDGDQAAADAATLARIADRARLRGTRRHLKSIPPPDYGGRREEPS